MVSLGHHPQSPLSPQRTGPVTFSQSEDDEDDVSQHIRASHVLSFRAALSSAVEKVLELIFASLCLELFSLTDSYWNLWLTLQIVCLEK